MTDSAYKYWAFLSCSEPDNRGQRGDPPATGHRCWGDWLHTALTTFSVPAEFAGQINGWGEIIPERIESIFREEPEASGADPLSTEMRQALEQSRCLIVVCSPRSAQSHQVNEAVRYFKQLGRGQQIFPIVVAGEPNASEGSQPGKSPADECFVPALRHPVSPAGTVDSTRRAGKWMFVDARQGGNHREILAHDDRHAEADLEMAKIQLIALLLGVGFNGLWWREQKRHFLDLAEARHQTQAALNQVAETRRQLQAAQQQTRAAQSQALETQNLPRDIQGQIQEAQNQTRAAQQQLQEFQDKVRDTEAQLAAARHRVLAAESQILEAQQQARTLQNQLEASRDQARAAQNQVLEMQNLTQAVPGQIQSAQSQIEETRQQTQAAQNKFAAAQTQMQEFQNQARSAQSELEIARQQVREAQSKILEAQYQVKELQNRRRNARRLTKVFALLAVLALLAASQAWRQRQAASQVRARAAAAAAGKFELAPGGLGQEPLGQLLWNLGGKEPAENRRRSLETLAVSIPRSEIAEALKASAVIVDDQQRSHFQKWLLIRLGWVNPLPAMAYASAITGKIVNDAGANDSNSYFQLAVLDNWMQTDLSAAFDWVCQLPDADARTRALEKIIPALTAANPQATLARLNTLQPAPDEQIYRRLFQHLAAHDPGQAIQQRQLVPDQDQHNTILCAILTVWTAQQPAAAVNWVQSQPDTETRNQALATCIGELAKTDVSGALALTESLPEGTWRSLAISAIAGQTNPAVALPETNGTPTIMQPRNAPWPWAKFLHNSNVDSAVIFPVETAISSQATNSPIQIKPAE